MALAKHSPLLVLDEPVASLDPVARLNFISEVMAAVADTGLTVVISSHVVAELQRRARFQRPLSLRLPHSAHINFGPNGVPPMTGHLGDWVLGVTTTAKNQLVSYQPADRFWTFQLIEADLYIALAAAALGAAIWLLRRRAA